MQSDSLGVGDITLLMEAQIENNMGHERDTRIIWGFCGVGVMV